MPKERFFKPLMAEVMLLCGLLFCVSCGQSISHKRLSDIESYIDSRPDSALVAIRQIDTTALRGRAAKAKYSLLHAMALDKNYIDTADTRIAQPAVDWYSRHGSPEERLKAYMYLGVEQYNQGQYNHAIVSFFKAAGFADRIEDQNLLGVLYSRTADTFTKTLDYSLASSYIDKSLECFRLCGRKDQEMREMLRQANNLAQMRRWEEADSCFLSLLSDPNIIRSIRSEVEIDYALNLLTSPISSDTLALSYLRRNKNSILSHKTSNNLKGAYAYALFANSYQEASDSVMIQIQATESGEDVYYKYWRHRILKKKGDYKQAYLQLWEAQQIADSLSVITLANSAANAQREFNEQVIQTDRLKTRTRLYFCLIIVLLSVALAILSWIGFRRKKHEKLEEIERMNTFIGTLESQLVSLADEMKKFESRISTLSREKTKAKFAYLSELLEILQDNQDELNEENLRNTYFAIKRKVCDLSSDANARNRFERLLNEESNNIVYRFRMDFPQLPEESIRLASLVFAGFDNATLSLLLGDTSTNTRTLKNRLMRKILSSNAQNKDEYLAYFPRKGQEKA